MRVQLEVASADWVGRNDQQPPNIASPLKVFHGEASSAAGRVVPFDLGSQLPGLGAEHLEAALVFRADRQVVERSHPTVGA
jgi:hypothetical protein